MTPTSGTSSTRLFGCGTALVTPFGPTGEVDEPALRALVEWQVEQGIHYLVPVGSTGEAATLAPFEQRQIVEIVVDQVRGRVPVVAGAGSNDTTKAIFLSREMQAAGATHLLHVSPMYNKPPQRGLLAHFRAIADATTLPIVIYNVPGRTASNVEAKTTLTLAEDRRFVAVKEASGNLGQIADIIAGRPEHFAVLSGDDALTLAVMAMGGDGVISVISNATPWQLSRLCELMRDREVEAARAVHEQLLPWMHAAFVESNPIPVKAALARMGKVRELLRLPLVPLADVHRETVHAALAHAGVSLS